jgi:CRP/FNR family transcriptional regulator, cyclic AMP receptor protein
VAKREHVAHLSQIDLLSDCSKRELEEVAKISAEISVPAGTSIVDQGDVGQEAYVILDGTAIVRRGNRKVAELGPGDPIGEMAIIDKGPRSAHVIAKTDMRLLMLTAKGFDQALERSPSLSRKLLAKLAGRVRELDRAAFG